MLGSVWPVEQLTYADDLEAIGSGRRGRLAALFMVILIGVFGFTVQRAKTRGCLKVDWIGLHCDYTTYTMGLSETRAA